METEWMGLGKCKDLSPSIFFPSDGGCNRPGRGAGRGADPAPFRLPQPALAMNCCCGRRIVRGQPYRLESRLEACCYSCASTVVGGAPSPPSYPAIEAVVGR
jgi:hypothetical protein